jgi:hypothetical protein
MVRTGTSVSVVGAKKKLDNRPELKFTVTEVYNISAQISNGAFAVLFNPNTQYFATTNFFITMPGQGTGEQQYIGNQINSLYVQYRVQLAVTDVQTRFDFVRMCLMRPKQVSPNNITSGGLPAMPTGHLGFIDNKHWNVMFDKIYGMTTGNTFATGQYSIGKIFTFNIPLRETIETSPTSTRFLWDRPPVLLAITQNAQISVIGFTVKFFYRDP